MPQFRFLLTLGIRVEYLKEVLALSYLSVGIGMQDLSKILHQSEVSSHTVSQASHLTQRGNQSNFIPGLSILVDQQGLVWLSNIFIVSGLVVVLVADLGSLLIEGGLWTLSEVNSFNFVCLLIVPKKQLLS
jgi:hypothetical protein